MGASYQFTDLWCGLVFELSHRTRKMLYSHSFAIRKNVVYVVPTVYIYLFFMYYLYLWAFECCKIKYFIITEQVRIDWLVIRQRYKALQLSFSARMVRE
jgi:hypothetical protein